MRRVGRKQKGGNKQRGKGLEGNRKEEINRIGNGIGRKQVGKVLKGNMGRRVGRKQK